MNIWKILAREWRQIILDDDKIEDIGNKENNDFEIVKQEIAASKTAGSILDDIFNDDYDCDF